MCAEGDLEGEFFGGCWSFFEGSWKKLMILGGKIEEGF